jgi:redox-regulated HSP33 family molecular chaperone
MTVEWQAELDKVRAQLMQSEAHVKELREERDFWEAVADNMAKLMPGMYQVPVRKIN